MEKKGTKTVLKCTISTYTYTSKIVGARCVYWRTDFLVLSIHGTPYLVGLYIPCRYGIFIISTLVGINSIRGEVERRILTDMWVVQLFFSDFKCHINITSAKTTIQTILVSYMHCFESWGTHHIWYYGLGMDFRLDDNVRNLKGISSLWSLYLFCCPVRFSSLDHKTGYWLVPQLTKTGQTRSLGGLEGGFGWCGAYVAYLTSSPFHVALTWQVYIGKII
jgi:hypothetical protein